MHCLPLLGALALLAVIAGQSSNLVVPSSPTPSLSLSLTTGSATVTTITRIGNQISTITTVVPSTFNVTYTISATSTASTSSHSTSSNPLVLDTKVDPAFGVLGAILILTGLPSTFWGHKNRWTSFFLIGFYTLSLVCFVLILKFGILAAVNPPTKSLRGLFVLSSAIAGIAGGAVAIFFWKAARYGIGAWGGFALALWIQCFHNGGLIGGIGFRWIFYIGCAVVGFILCTIPKIHYHMLLISTAFVGSSAFMLGVDCFTTAGLKEFYIWNLGFRSLFPKFTTRNIQFPVSQTMQIELGLTGAIAVMGAAVQLRILSVLHKRLDEIGQEQRRRDEEAENHATRRFATVKREQAEWEKVHPTPLSHGRQESHLSSLPLLKDHEGSVSPTTTTAEPTLVQDGRPRYLSGSSDFKMAPTSEEELRRTARGLQSPGVLPALDLGLGIQEDVPHGFITSDELRIKEKTDELRRKDLSPTDLEELRRKEELVLEIQTIRRSIEALKSEASIPSSSNPSRRPSMTSRRTLSVDANHVLLPASSHLRPPRETDPRTRAHSMEMSLLGYSLPLGEAISRPTSVPIRDEDWDSYVQHRKLLQPPAGVTPPIATTVVAAPRIPIAPAVTEALNRRKQHESAIGYGEHNTDSSDDIPLAKVTRLKRVHSTGGNNLPVTILPPRRASATLLSTPPPASPSRTRTFEELNERHREKIHDLQAPITQAAKEEANIRAARQRWERNKELEREAVTRRQAEKTAQVEKRKRTEDGGHRSGRNMPTGVLDQRHSHSPSHDRLVTIGSPSKRLSTLKVEDWQKYQQETEKSEAMQGGSGSKRESRMLSPSSGVPFPDGGKRPSRRMG